MKKLTIELHPNPETYGWNMEHAGKSIGRLCGPETRETLRLVSGRSYRLRVRQTKTRTRTTSFTLDKSYNESIWSWKCNIPGILTPFDNVFLSWDTDRFLSETFGESGRVFIRTKVEEIS